MHKYILNHKLFIGAYIAILSICIFQSCDKKPTKPDPEPEEHLFYVKAAYGPDSSIIKTFSVEQLKFIDSFTIENFSIVEMIVIGDNDRLLVAEGYRIRVYDLNTKEIVYSADGYGYPLQVSHNSEYFLAYSDRLQIRRTDDYRLIYTDDATTGTGDFSFDSKYYIYSRDLGEVVVYNIEGDSIETTFNLTKSEATFNIYELWPSVDMSKLFLIGYYGSHLDFAAADFNTDTVRILQAPLKTGGEEAIVSPDGEHLYFVNTPYMDAELPSQKVDVYNVETEELITSISTSDYDLFEPSHIALTSDGRYIMATPWLWGGKNTLLIDGESLAAIKACNFGENYPRKICTKR